MNPDDVATYLKTLKPGYLPQSIFLETARLTVLAVVELVPVRMALDGSVEILLVQRPKGDIWEGQWHVPGTAIRTDDAMAHGHDYAAPLKRLLTDELAGIETVGIPVEVETERRRVARGDELAVMHYVEVTGEPIVGRFFLLDGYPGNVPEPGIVPHHDGFVKRTAQDFQRTVADKVK